MTLEKFVGAVFLGLGLAWVGGCVACWMEIKNDSGRPPARRAAAGKDGYPDSPPGSPSSRRSLGGRWESNFDLCSSVMRRQGFRTESFIRDECEALATAAGRESLATMVEEIERCVAVGRSESSCLASHRIFRRLPQR